MNPESVKQILESLEKNGSMALDAIAYNASINAWGDIWLLVALAIITPLSVWASVKLWLSFHGADYDDDAKWLAGALVSTALTVVFVTCLLAGAFGLPNAIATIKNPRAAAVRILLQR